MFCTYVTRVAEIAQVAHEHVEADVALGVAEVRVPVDGRPADVHADPALVQRFELFRPSRQTIVKL